ncbi:hypothetical protein FOA52_002233 [Chlamydomonas sp. UWO 241]|nr:hypothetical protein FOA52_002233 [Chlamydomonas sp. UWO 241]
MQGLNGRRVRPRPMNYNERMPVVRTHGPNGSERLDSKLLAFLAAQEEEQELMRVLEGRDHAAARPAKGKGGQLEPSIAVPQVRDVADYAENQAALSTNSTKYRDIDPATTAYIRNQDLFAPQTMEQVLTDYDMDEEDGVWLAKYNAKVTKGTDKSKCLSPAEFENLVVKLEGLMQEAVVAEGPSGWHDQVKMGKAPKLPAAERLLTRGNVAAQLRETHDQGQVLAVYDHWIGRRRCAKGPLIGHMWFQEPWKEAIFCVETEAAGALRTSLPLIGHMWFQEPWKTTIFGEEHSLPFSATETKNSRGGHRLRMGDEEALKVMMGLRGELELLRTLADQVRKRERLKKQLLKIWRMQKLNQPINLASLPPLRPTGMLAASTKTKKGRGQGASKGGKAARKRAASSVEEADDADAEVEEVEEEEGPAPARRPSGRPAVPPAARGGSGARGTGAAGGSGARGTGAAAAARARQRRLAAAGLAAPAAALVRRARDSVRGTVSNSDGGGGAGGARGAAGHRGHARASVGPVVVISDDSEIEVDHAPAARRDRGGGRKGRKGAGHDGGVGGGVKRESARAAQATATAAALAAAAAAAAAAAGPSPRGNDAPRPGARAPRAGRGTPAARWHDGDGSDDGGADADDESPGHHRQRAAAALRRHGRPQVAAQLQLPSAPSGGGGGGARKRRVSPGGGSDHGGLGAGPSSRGGAAPRAASPGAEPAPKRQRSAGGGGRSGAHTAAPSAEVLAPEEAGRSSRRSSGGGDRGGGGGGDAPKRSHKKGGEKGRSHKRGASRLSGGGGGSGGTGGKGARTPRASPRGEAPEPKLWSALKLWPAPPRRQAAVAASAAIAACASREHPFSHLHD